MKRIGIDLDGTVADFLGTATPIIQSMYGLTPDYSKPAYRIEEIFGLTKESRPPDMKERLYVEHKLFRNLKKLEEDNQHLTSQLVQAIPRLKIYFVTAREGDPRIVSDTRVWLDNNTNCYDDIFHVTEITKGEFCSAAGIEVMIEDEAGNILSLLENNVKVVVMDQPWNRHLIVEDLPGKVVRVSDWKQAVSAAKEFLR